MGLPHHEESLHKLPCPFPPHPQTLQSLIQLGLPWAGLNLGGLKNMWLRCSRTFYGSLLT